MRTKSRYLNGIITRINKNKFWFRDSRNKDILSHDIEVIKLFHKNDDYEALYLLKYLIEEANVRDEFKNNLRKNLMNILIQNGFYNSLNKIQQKIDSEWIMDKLTK